MGHHGWRGEPPATEASARARILEAARRCVDRSGVAKTTLSDVATDLGITRQTVYRYFPSLADLLQAVAEAGAEDFVARMRRHLVPSQAPSDVLVEAIVFCVQQLPREPSIGLLLQAEGDLFGRGITSPTGFTLGAEFLSSLAVDWRTSGLREADLPGLAELMLRLIGSFLQHPSSTSRSEEDLRVFLRRWVAGTLASPTSP